MDLIILDFFSQMKEGENMIISGWGSLSSGGSSPNILQVAYVPLVTHAYCQDKYSKSGYDITEDMVCAGFPTG